MASNFSVMPIRWLLTIDSEMALWLFHSLAEGVLVFFQNSCGARKTHCQTGEFQSIKFHSQNRYRTHRFVFHGISVFSVKFTVEFTSQAMNFFIEESKENDLII